jgi:hypothetical protein
MKALVHARKWALFAAALSVWHGCASGNRAGSDADAEFRRCLDQEGAGASVGCWSLFLQRHGSSASEGQLRHARERVGGVEPGVALRPRDGSGDPNLVFPTASAQPDACYAGFEPAGDAKGDLDALTKRCGKATGMLVYVDTVTTEHAAGRPALVYGLPLQKDRCYRVFAAAGPGVTDLDAILTDAQGNPLAADRFQDSAPILGPQGPVCPPEDGAYRLILSVEAGSGPVSFQIWHGARGSFDTATGAFPQGCGQFVLNPDYGPLQVGAPVRLGRHREVEGDTNWAESMDPFVDTVALITSLRGVDGQGCPGVRVQVDEGAHFWRIRDLQAVVPLPPVQRDAAGAVLPPQECGFTSESALYGAFGLEAEVILGRHRPVDGDANWASEMENFASQRARVTRLRGVDNAGCPVVSVDVDGGEFAWRTRDLTAAPAEPFLGGGDSPSPSPGGELVIGADASVSALITELEALAHPGSDGWDQVVKQLVASRFDADGSGDIDTVAELHAVPCMVWQAMDKRVRQRSSSSSLLVTYGFLPDLIYLGESLGVAQGLREIAQLRLEACQLQ